MAGQTETDQAEILKDWETYLSPAQQQRKREGDSCGHAPQVESYDGSPSLTYARCSCGWVGVARCDSPAASFEHWGEHFAKMSVVS